jgi:hypothetical protein
MLADGGDGKRRGGPGPRPGRPGRGRRPARGMSRGQAHTVSITGGVTGGVTGAVTGGVTGGRYLRRITPAAALGYAAGVATLLLQTRLLP